MNPKNRASLIPMASAETRAARIEKCRPCPHRTVVPVVEASICKRCGCPIASKTRLASASCPEARW
jgi:hypothetical protein